jgi:hypothetical protein
MTSHNFSEHFKQRVKLSHFFLGLLTAVVQVFFLQQVKGSFCLFCWLGFFPYFWSRWWHGWVDGNGRAFWPLP